MVIPVLIGYMVVVLIHCRTVYGEVKTVSSGSR